MTKSNETTIFNIKDFIIPILLAVFVIWQGSYFPIQFFMLIGLFLIAFILKGKSVFVTKEVLILGAMFFLYLVSFLLNAENLYNGLVEVLRAAVFPMSLILFLNINLDKIEKALFIAIFYVAIFGLLDVFEVIYIPGGVDESVGRLHSTIQYANMAALLMLVGILYCIRDIMLQKQNKIISFAALVLFALSLYLTGSSTTLGISMFVCALYIFMVLKQRSKIIITGIVIGVVGAAIIAALHSFTDIRIFRITIFESTFIERIITFQDAVGMLNGRWLLGIGTGNWQEWQILYQSAPYHVRFIHNYYMQLFLDAGIFAPILFFAALIPSIIRGIKLKSVHSMVIIAFVLHSFLDIGFIFAAGVMITTFSIARLNEGGKKINIGRWRYTAIMPLILVAILWGSEFSSTIAQMHRVNGNIEASMSANKTALTLNPLNADLYFRMAQSTRDIQLTEHYIRVNLERNPRNLHALAELARIEKNRGNFKEALHYSTQLVEARPFLREFRYLHVDIARVALYNGVINYLEYTYILEKIDDILANINPLYLQFHRSELPE